MEIINDSLVYSATDLVGFLECGHLTSLERAAVSGHLERPVRSDPVLDRIAQRGQLHEERFLDSLLSEGFRAVKLEPDPDLPPGQRLAKRRDETLAAMRAGADVVYQAALFNGRRLGFSDFLRRVEQASDLGPWSYEVWDTKGNSEQARLIVARHAKMDQPTFARLEYQGKKRKTRRELFLERMDGLTLAAAHPSSLCNGATLCTACYSDPGIALRENRRR